MAFSDASDLSEFGTCFVCLNDDEPAPRSQCACRTYLHRSCQRRMIAVQQNPRVCMVCKRHYANVHTTTRHRECAVYVLAVWLASSSLLYVFVHDWRANGVSISSCVVLTSAIYLVAYAGIMLYTASQHTCPTCDESLRVRLL